MAELVDARPGTRDAIRACGSLLRLSVAIGLDAGEGVVIQEVACALRDGCSADEVVAVLPVIAPLVGSLRLMAAAPAIAVALGYDLETALFG
jgi:hypothetical protein